VQRLNLLEVGDVLVVYHLRVLEAHPVKEVDEPHVLLFPVVPDPSPQGHFGPLQRGQLFLQFPGGECFHENGPPVRLECFAPILPQSAGKHKHNANAHSAGNTNITQTRNRRAFGGETQMMDDHWEIPYIDDNW